jgi:imidazolonepropionase-like amidohydrolase
MRPLAALFALLLSVVTGSTSQAQTGATWITNVTIVSPEKLDRIEKGSVLIENGHITRVERKNNAKVPAGATVISGKGQYLIPGLIDSHVHLSSVPGMTWNQEQANQAMVKAYLKQMPRSYLYYGYTTLVDLVVTEPDVLNEFRKEPLHPDLYDCGNSLPIANGYPMSFSPPDVRFKLFPNFIYDPKQADRIPAEYKPEDHTPAVAVARVKSSGAVCVKTYYEKGFADDKNLPVMGPDVLEQIRKEATANGLLLMIHANSLEAQKFAADGNVDVIVHGMWHWGDLNKQPELPAEVKQVLDRIVEKRIGYQPTFQVIYGEMAYFDPAYLKMPALAKVAPPALLAWFSTPEGKWFGKELNDALNEKGAPDSEVLKFFEEPYVRHIRQTTAYLAARNANFVFGTDTPSAPTYGNLPGLNGYLEMQHLREGGLSLEQIFRAATISNAKELKLDSQIGTIEPGKIANLILTTKSPLESLDAYDSITTVFVHGKPIRRETLAANSK